MRNLAQLDQQFVWHPFTQMRDWMQREPIVITRGDGAVLEDSEGRKYLDGNSSIWTNLHGHNRAEINQAIAGQLHKIAHSSALGLANEPASILAAELIRLANPPSGDSKQNAQPSLTKVFYSDDGSTAMEVALKLAYEFSRRVWQIKRPRFLSLAGAYHGDTIGAVSLGHMDLFHKSYQGLLFRSDQVMAPYCYRCPFNRAKPERADARSYRKCHWECVDKVAQKFQQRRRLKKHSYAGMIVEPLMQGAAGLIPHPQGWLQRVAEIVRANQTLLITDEVMTGFGRARCAAQGRVNLFASHEENVQPDLMALAKGLTGGYLPMAATLASQPIFDAFLGEYEEFKTFFHGHSYTANQLGSAAGLASLRLLQTNESTHQREALATALKRYGQELWDLPQIGDIRQVGTILGIELVKDWPKRTAFALKERVGIRVCEAMAKRGVLTRPIGNVIVLMPPYCTTPKQVETMVASLKESVMEVLGPAR